MSDVDDMFRSHDDTTVQPTSRQQQQPTPRRTDESHDSHSNFKLVSPSDSTGADASDNKTRLSFMTKSLTCELQSMQSQQQQQQSPNSSKENRIDPFADSRPSPVAFSIFNDVETTDNMDDQAKQQLASASACDDTSHSTIQLIDRPVESFAPFSIHEDTALISKQMSDEREQQQNDEEVPKVDEQQQQAQADAAEEEDEEDDIFQPLAPAESSNQSLSRGSLRRDNSSENNAAAAVAAPFASTRRSVSTSTPIAAPRHQPLTSLSSSRPLSMEQNEVAPLSMQSQSGFHQMNSASLHLLTPILETSREMSMTSDSRSSYSTSNHSFRNAAISTASSQRSIRRASQASSLAVIDDGRDAEGLLSPDEEQTSEAPAAPSNQASRSNSPQLAQSTDPNTLRSHQLASVAVASFDGFHDSSQQPAPTELHSLASGVELEFGDYLLHVDRMIDTNCAFTQDIMEQTELTLRLATGEQRHQQFVLSHLIKQRIDEQQQQQENADAIKLFELSLVCFEFADCVCAHLAAASDQVNLVQLQQAYTSSATQWDESLQCFYAIELLRCVAQLHNLSHIVHGNLSLSALQLRDEPTDEWPDWAPNAKGWNLKGLRVIDWSQAVDLQAAGPQDAQRLLQQEHRQIATVMHQIAFGKQREAQGDNQHAIPASASSFMRRTFEPILAELTQPKTALANCAESGSRLSQLRSQLEQALVADTHRARQVKLQLAKQQILLIENAAQ